MSFSTTLYNAVFRRNSVFVGAILGTAFFYDIAFNTAIDKWWDNHNRGKLWKDIKSKYVKNGDDDDDDDE